MSAFHKTRCLFRGLDGTLLFRLITPFFFRHRLFREKAGGQATRLSLLSHRLKHFSVKRNPFFRKTSIRATGFTGGPD